MGQAQTESLFETTIGDAGTGIELDGRPIDDIAVQTVLAGAPYPHWVKDIADMHDKFGVNAVIRNLDKEKLQMFLKFRLDFLREELIEAYTAAGYEVSFDAVYTGVTTKNSADDVVDAMVDLCVVSIGTMNAFDVDAYLAWSRVHEKNMQKEPGIKASRPNPLNLPDLIKPAGWAPPSHADNVGLLSKVFDENHSA